MDRRLKKARRTMRRAPASAANFITSGPRILQSNLLPDEIADHADDVSQLSREPTESNRPATPLMSDFNKRLNPFPLFSRSLPRLYPRQLILLLLFAPSPKPTSSSSIFSTFVTFLNFFRLAPLRLSLASAIPQPENPSSCTQVPFPSPSKSAKA